MRGLSDLSGEDVAVLSECRFLAAYGKWFWTVEAPNPTPIFMPDGVPSRMDSRLIESSCSAPNRIGRATRRRDRDIERAKRRLDKKIATARLFAGDVP